MPKEKAPCECLSIIMLDSLLEECKYEQKKIKTNNYIDEDLEISESDNDSNDETDNDYNNLLEVF